MNRGIICVIGASLIFGTMASATKIVMLTGMSPECSTFYTQLTVCLLAFLVAKLKGEELKIGMGSALKLAGIGAVGMALTSFLVNSACLYIPAGLAVVLHFLYPTIVSVVMVLLFGQKMTKFKLAAILCSVCGMILISNLGGEGIGEMKGVLLALLSSLTYSFYMIANERGEINRLSLIVKLAYAGVGGTLFTLGLTLFSQSLTLPATALAAFVQFAVCGAGHMAAFYLLTAGIRHVGASTASFINMLEPITSVIVSTLLFRDALTAMMVLGVVLVLSSVFMVALDGHRLAES